MTKLQFNTRDLRDALRWVVDHINPTPTNPSDAAILMSPTQDGYVVLTGARDQSAARARLAYTGDTLEEETAIHAHSLHTVVRSAPGSEVVLTLNDSNAIVKSGPARSRIPYLSADDVSAARQAVQIPRQGTVNAAEFISAINSLTNIPVEDAAAPQFSGIKVDLKDGDKLAIAATDRSILGATKIGFKAQEQDVESEDLELDILIPNRTLGPIARALPTDGEVWIHWENENQRRLALSTDDLWVSFTLLEPSKFPPHYEDLLAAPDGTTFEVDRKAFSAVLARAGTALGREGFVFGISTETVEGNGGEFTIKASGAFDHEEELTARVTGESIDAAVVSAQHLTQAVKSANGDTATMVLGERHVMITSDYSDHAKYVVPRMKNR